MGYKPQLYYRLSAGSAGSKGEMPKETIYPSEYNEDMKVEVQWAKDMYVQIGVAHLPPPEDPSKGTIEWDGKYLTLDRNEINRLIRILRKARDQAFGADA